MTNDENPFGFFSSPANKRKVKPSKPKPEVILHGRHGMMPADEFQLFGEKTTYDENGTVTATAEFVAKGWHFHSFCERQYEDGNSLGNGTWIMFAEDVMFRAGEGVWLIPTQCMKAPRVEIRR
ncbi:hypothetical protein KRZ98_05230 [Sphingobium sp. AS12]|uniref:hypothetical protein n=1 Tax=Sphingobium sp. AS12 TaxID=2849495 RepID=UPI001C318074|nr:hypothetical protein [Sphingobium sp. AS12]MBV2147688.1 hypothetical protein [Sphingobium sp. AS12]